METLEAVGKRASLKMRISARDVEQEKIAKILDAARLAPSAGNRQPWRFIVVKGRENVETLVSKAFNEINFAAKEAPVIIVACAETDVRIMRCGQLSYPIDVAIALDHISLAAVELGLGTCWIGAFDEHKVKEILGIPKEIRVVELMPLGYPSDPSPVEKNRLPIDMIVKYEHW